MAFSVKASGAYRRTLVVSTNQENLVRVAELEGEEMEDHLARELTAV